jgi:hypothetical protein
MARLCKLCGEPLADHDVRPPDERTVALRRARSGRHPAQVRAALVGGVIGQARVGGRLAGKLIRETQPLRSCPVFQVARMRPDGSEYLAWVPKRLATDDAA